MLKAVKFDRQFRIGAIEIQNVSTNHMLSPEFETGKASSAQCPPEFFFLVGLITTKPAGDWFEAHGGKILVAGKNSNPLTPALSPFWRGEGDDAECGAAIIFKPQSFFNSVPAS